MRPNSLASLTCSHLVDVNSVLQDDWRQIPQFSLVLILRGHGQRFTAETTEIFLPGDLALFPPGVAHGYRVDRVRLPDPAIECLDLRFTLNLASTLRQESGQPNLEYLLVRAQEGLHFPPTTAAKIEPVMRALSAGGSTTRWPYLADILGILSDGAFRSLGTPSRAPIPPHALRRVQAAQVYAKANFDRRVRQGEISKRVGLTSTAFTKSYKKIVGHTFGTEVKRLRIGMALRMLSDQSARITDVALDCGYRDPDIFRRHFQEATGMLPREYRRRHKSSAAAQG